MPTESQLEDILREIRTTEPGTHMSSIKLHYYNETSKHLRFLQQILSDGNPIKISDTHRNILKIRDSIGDAINKDLRDAGFYAYSHTERSKSQDRSQKSQFTSIHSRKSASKLEDKNGESSLTYRASMSDSDSSRLAQKKKSGGLEITAYQKHCQETKKKRR